MTTDVEDTIATKGKVIIVIIVVIETNASHFYLFVYGFNVQFLEVSKRIVLCSASCPVWICEHAISLPHPCTFLYCNDCRTEAMAQTNDGIRLTRHQGDNQKAKRVKPNPVDYLDDNDTDDNDIAKCNHKMESLQKLEDGKYFTDEYVTEKKQTPNSHYASICYKCKGHVRDRVPA